MYVSGSIFIICLLHYAKQENIGAQYTLCRDKCLLAGLRCPFNVNYVGMARESGSLGHPPWAYNLWFIMVLQYNGLLLINIIIN